MVKKLVPTARVPTRGSAFAAGYDLYCAKAIVIPAKGKGLVDTGLAIAVPEGTCMCPRPSLGIYEAILEFLLLLTSLLLDYRRTDSTPQRPRVETFH